MRLDTEHRFGAGEGIVGLREIVRIRAICCREYGGLTTFHTTDTGYYFQGPSYTTPYDKHMELAILAAVGKVNVCESHG